MTSTPRDILLLGSTGSIGTQALDIIEANSDRFRVVGLAAGGGSRASADLLISQAHRHPVSLIAVASEDMAAYVADRVEARVLSGPTAAEQLVREQPAHTVLNGMVGSQGLGPTLAALDLGAVLALANKESLIAGGELVLARVSGLDSPALAHSSLVPVDSEHSAMAQCLRSGTRGEVARLVLTASGGPFRGWAANDLTDVTPDQAGAHPTWSMGPINTLNSATLVNKGLELIEASLLFGVPVDDIDVVVHPQSIVHSMATFRDGSTIAQASPPSMHLPIALALGWPDRVPQAAPALDWTRASRWDFEPLDNEVFPAVRLARAAAIGGGTLPAVYNAANEEAAERFLAGRLRFPDIVGIVDTVLATADRFTAPPRDIDDVLATEEWARAAARTEANRRAV